MKYTKYPLTLAAAKKGESSLWEIGDALLKECPPDSDHRKLSEVVAYLQVNGCDYLESWLHRLRATAAAFPKFRRGNFAFSVYDEAGTPEILDAIVKGVPKGTLVTKRYVQKIVQRLRDHEQRELEEQRDKAQAELEAAKAEEERVKALAEKAKTKAERQKAAEQEQEAKERTKQAKKKRQQAKIAPKKSPAPPKKEDVPVLAAEAGFLAAASQSIDLAKRSEKEISTCLDELTPKGIAALTDVGLEAVNAWRDAVQVVRKELLDQTGHISLVGE
jgi:hypothetical protein